MGANITITGKDGAKETRYRSGPLQKTIRIGQPGPDGSTLGTFICRLFWTDEPCEAAGLTWVDFELVEVQGQHIDQGKLGAELFEVVGAMQSGDHTEDIEQATTAADGSVKWDGCTQFEVAPVHIDHRTALESLFAAIQEARRQCALVMSGHLVGEEYPEETG